MAHVTVKEIYDADRSRRVVIYKRDDGTFGIEQEYFSNEPRELCWIPRGGRTESFLDSLERAEAEARGRFEWLGPYEERP